MKCPICTRPCAPGKEFCEEHFKTYKSMLLRANLWIKSFGNDMTLEEACAHMFYLESHSRAFNDVIRYFAKKNKWTMIRLAKVSKKHS
jgi:hypothetical protein